MNQQIKYSFTKYFDLEYTRVYSLVCNFLRNVLNIYERQKLRGKKNPKIKLKERKKYKIEHTYTHKERSQKILLSLYYSL